MLSTVSKVSCFYLFRKTYFTVLYSVVVVSVHAKPSIVNTVRNTNPPNRLTILSVKFWVGTRSTPGRERSVAERVDYKNTESFFPMLRIYAWIANQNGRFRACCSNLEVGFKPYKVAVIIWIMDQVAHGSGKRNLAYSLVVQQYAAAGNDIAQSDFFKYRKLDRGSSHEIKVKKETKSCLLRPF